MTSLNSLHQASALGDLGERVDRRLQQMRDEQVVRRIWHGDYTVWQPQDGGITDRLGWLTIIEPMLREVDRLRSFAKSVAIDDCHNIILLGMGGSSLAPEVLWTLFGLELPFKSASVLDTTDPDAILAAQERVDLTETLFIASSKSGTTIETLSLLQHFLRMQPSGHQYVAITDAGTPLDTLAASLGFRHTFPVAPDIGGRYSALSHFGLVPAALVGIDIKSLLERGQEMLDPCRDSTRLEKNPGAWLGATLGEAALAGRDKLTLVLPEEIASLGSWIEQLIAESTGKDGKGIVPIDREPLGPPDVYGSDRLFVSLGEHAGLDALERAGHPVVRLRYDGVQQIGGEFMRWMFATAVAGHVLQINPFNEPNVQEAKDATAKILSGSSQPVPTLPSLADLLSQVRANDYLALQAFLPRSHALDAELQPLRLKLRDRLKVATTLGYGPRYMHSTGQLHKGGPNSGVFVQLIDEPARDIPIPGQSYTFGRLKRAQADGDILSLLRHRRRVTRVTLNQLREAAR
jgi:glucose-6-phosphate isomerase